MPFVYKRLRPNILHVIGSGHLDDEELGSLVQRLRQDPRLEAEIDLLVDLRPVVTAEISTALVRRLAQGSAPRTARRVALVTDLDVIFGLARMFQSLRGGEVAMEVFRSFADALAWLEEERVMESQRVG